MNLIVFKSEELVDGGLLRLTGDRVAHIRTVLGACVGQTLKIGQIGGNIGVAEILLVDQEEVVLKVINLVEPAVAPNIDLILALPRPQMLKRVLENIPGLGVRRLFLIRSNRVEKSYFASPVLSSDNIERHLRIGMEQAVTTYMPEVRIFDKFKPFMEDALEGFISNTKWRFIAHADKAQDLSEVKKNGSLAAGDVVVAIGPEGGWLEHEVNCFENYSFCRVGLGSWTLRVETAVYSAMSQIKLLQRMD